MAIVKAKGVDVSKWQGSIDWKQVKASGINFAMIRLGRGEYDGGRCALDTCFKQNIAGALEAELDVGVYFYSYALTAVKAKAEAEFVVNELAVYKGRLTYPVAFDLEDSSQVKLRKDVLSDMVVAFGDVIEKAGYYASLYSNLNWLTNKYDTAKIKRFDIWLAQWASKPTYPGSFGMWQYSNAGSVPGISGRVDLDAAYYDYPAIILANGLNGFQKGTPAPDPIPSSYFKPGDKVKVRKAVTYTGDTFKAYYDAYNVIEVSGDRVVIGIGKTVTAAVNVNNLTKL